MWTVTVKQGAQTEDDEADAGDDDRPKVMIKKNVYISERRWWRRCKAFESEMKTKPGKWKRDTATARSNRVPPGGACSADRKWFRLTCSAPWSCSACLKWYFGSCNHFFLHFNLFKQFGRFCCFFSLVIAFVINFEIIQNLLYFFLYHKKAVSSNLCLKNEFIFFRRHFDQRWEKKLNKRNKGI